MGMGYQGYVKFTHDSNSMVVLTTGASVNLVLEPIMSQAVWGAGWYNAATSAHYADNAIRYEGNIDLELQMGDSGNFWLFLRDFIINNRANAHTVEISPDGAHLYKYTAVANQMDTGAYCTSANFAASEGSFVTCGLGVVALTRTESNPEGGTNYSSFSYLNQIEGVIGAESTEVTKTQPLNPDGTNNNPIPYWKSNALVCKGTYTTFQTTSLYQAGAEATDWGIDITNNEKILYTCSGVRNPKAVLMGPMGATGNVTLYHPTGIIDPILGDGSNTNNNPYSTAENTWFVIEIGTGTSGKVYIELPAVVIQADAYNISGADSVTNRAFTFTGMGGRVASSNTLPPCIMSNYSGAYAHPS